MGTPPGWGLDHRASNPVSVKNLTAIETSTIVKLRPYVPAGTKRTSKQASFTRKTTGVPFSSGAEILFLFATASRPALGPIQLPMCTRDSFPEGKATGM
jgi:hypothetical protein